MAEHTLKVQPPYFAALLDGTKTFEVRRNDRAYQTGDTLILEAWDGTYPAHGQHPPSDGCCRITRTITFVYSGDPRFGGHGGMQPGYVVLGLGGELADPWLADPSPERPRYTDGSCGEKYQAANGIYCTQAQGHTGMHASGAHLGLLW